MSHRLDKVVKLYLNFKFLNHNHRNSPTFNHIIPAWNSISYSKTTADSNANKIKRQSTRTRGPELHLNPRAIHVPAVSPVNLFCQHHSITSQTVSNVADAYAQDWWLGKNWFHAAEMQRFVYCGVVSRLSIKGSCCGLNFNFFFMTQTDHRGQMKRRRRDNFSDKFTEDLCMTILLMRLKICEPKSLRLTIGREMSFNGG